MAELKEKKDWITVGNFIFSAVAAVALVLGGIGWLYSVSNRTDLALTQNLMNSSQIAEIKTQIEKLSTEQTDQRQTLTKIETNTQWIIKAMEIKANQ